MPENKIPQDRIETALNHFETWATENDCPGTSVAVTDRDGIIGSRGFWA